MFLFIGAPYVERLRGNPALSSALTGITAAVVGVIANLAVFFALHTLFDATRTLALGPTLIALPVLTTLDPIALGIAILAAVLLFRLKWSVLRTLGICAAVGVASAAVAALSG